MSENEPEGELDHEQRYDDGPEADRKVAEQSGAAGRLFHGRAPHPLQPSWPMLRPEHRIATPRSPSRRATPNAVGGGLARLCPADGKCWCGSSPPPPFADLSAL